MKIFTRKTVLMTMVLFLRQGWGLVFFLPLGVWAASAVEVSVKAVDDLVFYPQFALPATVATDERAVLNVQIGATVAEFAVEPGDEVSAGQVLVRFEDQDYRLALRRQQARLEQLQAQQALASFQFQRARKLMERNAISEELYKQRESAARGAQAQLAEQRIAVAQAQRQLDSTVIRAPFRGIVLRRLAGVGEYLMPGSPVIEVVGTAKRHVEARLPYDALQSLRSAGSVTFAAEGRRWPVSLVKVVNVVDEALRSTMVRLQFSAAPPAVGTAGTLRWRAANAYLPPEVVVRRHGQLGVFVAEGSRARFVPLPGAQEGRAVRLSAPLPGGVIVEGRHRLQDGDAVTIAGR